MNSALFLPLPAQKKRKKWQGAGCPPLGCLCTDTAHQQPFPVGGMMLKDDGILLLIEKCTEFYTQIETGYPVAAQQRLAIIQLPVEQSYTT